MFFSILSLLILSFGLGTFAGKFQDGFLRTRYRQNARTVESQNLTNSKVYALQDMYQGKAFLK